jgi:hypothetical protein
MPQVAVTSHRGASRPTCPIALLCTFMLLSDHPGPLQALACVPSPAHCQCVNSILLVFFKMHLVGAGGWEGRRSSSHWGGDVAMRPPSPVSTTQQFLCLLICSLLFKQKVPPIVQAYKSSKLANCNFFFPGAHHTANQCQVSVRNDTSGCTCRLAE